MRREDRREPQHNNALYLPKEEPRSSGAPTAGHHARAGGTRYIFTGPGLASCRRRPLSSNVKRETGGWKMPLVMAGYLFALAYAASFVTYRAALALGAG